jgi:hypothetical protein
MAAKLRPKSMSATDGILSMDLEKFEKEQVFKQTERMTLSFACETAAEVRNARCVQ